MSSGDVLDPPWAHVQFIHLSNFLTWKDFQILPTVAPAQAVLQPTHAPTTTTLHTLLLHHKNLIQEFNNENEWELRKKITNPYEYIFGMNDTNLPCVIPQTKSFTPLSRSFFKMIEMLEVSDFFNAVKQPVFSSAHVCEGPGGFIQALLLSSKLKERKVSQALAMTLRPSQPFIPGWRRSISYLREHPEIILEYGADSTGDILSFENQRVFVSKSAQKSMIFTADGGFDFSNDYSNQEAHAFLLILASFRMGLLSLAKGGFLIIKVFDVFMEQTKQLLLGSGLCFESFTLYKPATSRPCNSERYFIGRKFLGAQHATPWIGALTTVMRRLQAQNSSAAPSIPFLLYAPFMNELYRIFQTQLTVQAEQQVEAIQKGLQFTEDKKDEYTQKGLAYSKEWVKVFFR